MSNLKGVDIQKGRVGPNVLGGDDGVSAIIIIATDEPDEMEFGSIKIVYSMDDVKALGITEGFDDSVNMHCYHHIEEFYRMAGEGQELHMLLLEEDNSFSDVFDDTGVQMAKKLVLNANGKIRQLGIAWNSSAEIVMLNGLPTNVYNAISAAQGFYNWANENFMPLQILIEGYSYGGDSAAVANLRDLPNLEADKVSIIIGQDFEYAENYHGNLSLYADIGTALGTLSAAEINQNIGDNENFNLTDATKDVWMIPGLSNHVANKVNISSLQTLEDKGYIFGMEYVGLSGVRWNNDHVCTPIVIDADGNINEHTIAYGRTHDKARRLLRTALLPKVKTKQPVDKKTGKLIPGVVKYFENIGDDVFERMEKNTEISFGETTVDPDSDLIVDKELKVSFKIIPYGNVGFINGTSNLKIKE